MDEGAFKAALLEAVRAAGPARARPVVTAEFTLGSSGVRADLAVLDSEFIGIEIKSAADTLRRLPVQMAAYSRYFERTLLVVANCHVARIDPSQLSGAALWTAASDGRLEEVSPGIPNHVRNESWMDLLTQGDRLQYEKWGHDLSPACVKPNEEADAPLSAFFRSVFRKRYGATSTSFWRATGRRRIRSEDLTLLSRFSLQREQARKLAAENDARRERWVAAQRDLAYA